MHAGVSSEVAKAQGRARITAFSALGAVPSIDPGLAVLASLHMSWLRAHLYASLLEEQVGREAEDAPGSWNGDADPDDDDGYGPRGVARQSSPAGVAGLIGHVYAADKVAGIFASGEARRALVDLEAQERDRCVRFAKVAHDMGIAEREVRLAEQQGELMATVIRNILGDLALTPEQAELAPASIQRWLREAVGADVVQGEAS